MTVIDPTILLIALSAFFIGGILKGAMGFGLPMLAIPALTTVHSLPLALSITALPVVATNIWQIWAFRKYANWDFLVKFLATGAFGLVAARLY